MRSVSRFTSLALLVFLLGLLGFAVPRVATAQTAPVTCPSALPAGVSCTVVNGALYYSDNKTSSSGSNCITDQTTGVQQCVAGNNPSAGSQSGTAVSLGQGFGTVNGTPQQSTGTGWLSRLTGWLAYAINALFQAIAGLLRDMVVSIITNILYLVLMMIQAIPVPDFIKNYSMGGILGNAGAIVGFFCSKLQIPAGLALIASGYVFRLLRKFLTLFQW